jgi:hypothetical protein
MDFVAVLISCQSDPEAEMELSMELFWCTDFSAFLKMSSCFLVPLPVWKSLWLVREQT